MEMNCIRTCALFLITFGLFYLVKGKACPERVRPHKTRCEMYYKCMDLATQRHVWIPEKCEKGLVFENDLKMCVLPGDDWECELGEPPIRKNENKPTTATPQIKLNKDADIYVVSRPNESSKYSNDDGTIEVVLQSDISSEEDTEEENEKENVESSGDGPDFNEDLLKADNREMLEEMVSDEKFMDNEILSSTTTTMTTPSTTTFDPNLTAHLQRLSQLIDGLKKTYQNRDKEQAELGPDQLNAFLAHFNIRNKYDSIDAEPMHGNYMPANLTLTTTPATFNVNDLMLANMSDAVKQRPTPMFTTNQTNQISTKLKPETKVVLQSALPKNYATSNGFSNSQIVVNRPEGSVLFSLPPYGSQNQHIFEHTNTHSVQQYEQHVPKISEETLRTVLELSKQMIANQNVPSHIPNPVYYAQPLIQPLFLPPYAPRPPLSSSSSSSGNSPFSSYYGGSNNFGNADYDDKPNGYGKPSMFNYHSNKKKPHYSNGNKKPPKPQSGTTIIHNNVIPVHVTSTNSGEKEIVDSYGQSLGRYPPLNDANGNKNSYTLQVTHQYENNKFVTTVRPYVSTAASPGGGQFSGGQYPAPYSDDYAATTVRPPLQYQPSAATIAEYYTPSPHLSESNVNFLFRPTDRYPSNTQYDNLPRPIDPNRPDAFNSQYQQQQQQLERPASYQQNANNFPFPPQIDPNKVKIRPNSQKVESMEMDDDMNMNYNDQTAFSGSSDSANGNGYGNSNNFQFSAASNNRPQSSLLSYGGDGISSSNSNSFQHPYMPRPSNSYGNGINKPKFPTQNQPQLVNIGGSFISYNDFQNNILPLIGQAGATSSSSNIEVINCQPGVRQPNATDCTRYFVCSKKDGKVLSYACPPYTGFNAQTRICDARTYADCSPDAVISKYTITENKRIQLAAIQALNDAKRRQEEALKNQKLANLLQQFSNAQSMNYGSQNVLNLNAASDGNMLNSYAQQAAMSAANAAAATTTTRPPKKRKYYCKEGDKVPDQTSIYNYFVCYKNAAGMMKGKKMTCLKGLLFCPATTSCTLPANCT